MTDSRTTMFARMKRVVSPRLEKIIIGLLVQWKDDSAVRIVVENCR